MALTKVSYSMIDGALVNALDYGADPTGVTDSAAAIQAALDTEKAVFLPEGTYKISSTLTLTGTGTSLIGAGPKNTVLIADLAVSPVVQVSDGYYNVISNLRVTRDAGTPGATTAGIQWNDWNYGYEDCVVSDRHGYCWNYEGPATSTAVGHRVSRNHAYSAVTAYFRVNAIAGLYMSQCEAGTNEGDDFAPLYCMIVRGESNGCVWTDCEFIPRNASSGTTTTSIYFEDIVNVGVYELKGCNTENVKHCFGSNNANQTITELKVIGGRWTNSGAAINNWDTATTLFNCEFTGVVFGSGLLAFTSVHTVRLTGCWTEGLTLTGGSGGSLGDFAVVGCQIYGTFTASGEILSLNLVGNSFQGSYSNTATGNVSVFDAENGKLVSEIGAQLYVRNANQFAYGTAAPISLLTIKQTVDSSSGGLTQIAPNSANYWATRAGADNEYYFDYNGVIKAKINSTTGAYSALSDRNLKKDIEDISAGLNEISRLRPVSYLMKDEPEGNQKHLGFIAQEVLEVLPSVVAEFPDGTLALDKTEIIAVLVKAVQELSTEIEQLKANAISKAT
jgi:hypothetical protein